MNDTHVWKTEEDEDSKADTVKLPKISALVAVRVFINERTQNAMTLSVPDIAEKISTPPIAPGKQQNGDAPATPVQDDLPGILDEEATITSPEENEVFLPIDAYDTAVSLQLVRAEHVEPAVVISPPELSQAPEAVPGKELPLSARPVARPAQKLSMSRGLAIFLMLLLLVVVVDATNNGFAQFLGPQGWAVVLGGSQSTSNNNILQTVAKQLRQHPIPGATAQPITPQEYIASIVQHMTLQQKLGQLMIVQFVGPTYGLDISAMISQYNIGAVLVFTANDNIVSKPQLKGLIQQMQHNSAIPLIVAIDQEGGTVDRLISLDGPRPSATSIGETGNPDKAKAEGILDAQDLSSYGFNLNLAPVVDVTNVYNPQMYLRTFGTNPTIVTKMAGAYLQGLQQSGKVLGTLKHFPGLGDVGADPHSAVPHLTRSLSQLEAIDWAPYRALIKQGDVHAIMVTHELVTAVDPNTPSSLSYKLVTGILREQFGFQGVIVTDSLTMEGITAYYNEAQAAALAIEAGDDLIMGAASPSDVANMFNGIEQAMNAGQISMARIDQSVSRILMLKYEMGLIHLPTS
jgi:beta-N-acetylhexosaminidase